MSNSDPLVLYGIGVIIVVGCFIIIPYLRGKSELLTAWTAVLVGLILFSGFASIEVKYVPTISWEHLKWYQPSAHEVQWYMHANAVFIATLLVAYYLNSPAKRFAQRRLRKWPEVNIPVTFF